MKVYIEKYYERGLDRVGARHGARPPVSGAEGSLGHRPNVPEAGINQ